MVVGSFWTVFSISYVGYCKKYNYRLIILHVNLMLPIPFIIGAKFCMLTYNNICAHRDYDFTHLQSHIYLDIYDELYSVFRVSVLLVMSLLYQSDSG